MLLNTTTIWMKRVSDRFLISFFSFIIAMGCAWASPVAEPSAATVQTPSGQSEYPDPDEDLLIIEEEDFSTIMEDEADELKAESNADGYTEEELKEFIESGQQKEPQDENRNWWYLLKKGKLNLSDPTVEYPKFLRFVVNVYNWGDHFFNGFDPEWVQGTGHRWKARLVNENWADSYALRFRNSDVNMRMLSALNVNLGAYLQYMAVSVGYSLDMNTIFGGKKTDHTRFETNFNCALFNFDLTYTHNSGTYIRQFMGYNNDRLIRSDFPGVTANNLGVTLYYFLNNKRYSQGAAYNFSRFQRKSAGSWIFGLTYTYLDINMNFATLAPELKPLYTFPSEKLRLHYNSYCALFGYGYNWVIHPKWLVNATVMPSLGFNHCYEDSSDGSGNQFALNIHGRVSLTYNHRSLFASLIGRLSGNWYISRNLSLFNAIEYFSLNFGVRFW